MHVTGVPQEVGSTCVPGNIVVPTHTQFTHFTLFIIFLKIFLHNSMKWCSKFPTKVIKSRKISHTIAIIAASWPKVAIGNFVQNYCYFFYHKTNHNIWNYVKKCAGNYPTHAGSMLLAHVAIFHQHLNCKVMGIAKFQIIVHCKIMEAYAACFFWRALWLYFIISCPPL